MRRALHAAALLAAALLPGAAVPGDFAPASLRGDFTSEPPWFAGSVLAGGEIAKLADAAGFVGSVAELDPDEQFSPFPGVLGQASARFRGALWGVGSAFRGEAVGRRRDGVFEGRIETLLGFNAWRQEQLTERFRASAELDVFTGTRFTYRFASAVQEHGERWRSGGQLLAGVRYDFTDRLRVWARPGLRYQVVDVGDDKTPGTYPSGRLEAEWHEELVLPPRWPLWITLRGWAADDFTGRYAGLRLELRPSRRFQVGLESDSRWDELSVSWWPWRPLEATVLLHRDREYGTLLVAVGGRLWFGGLSVSPFFSR